MSTLSRDEAKSQAQYFDGLKYFWKIIRTGKLKPLSSSAKVLILILAWHSGNKTVCYPSIRTLVKETGLNRKTVQKAMRELKSMGYVDTYRYRWDGGLKMFYKLVDPDHIIPGKKEKNPPPPKTKMAPPPKSKMTPKMGAVLDFKQTSNWTELEQTDLKASAKGSEILFNSPATGDPGMGNLNPGNGNGNEQKPKDTRPGNYINPRKLRILNEKEWLELRRMYGIK
jgi:DNA-binding transcriptional ArsR family regulator